MRPSGWELAGGLCSTSVFHISVVTELKSMHWACTAVFVSKHQASRPDTTLSTAGIPISKEPAGLCHTDGRCPDGMSLIAWQAGKPAVWDVMVTCTTAPSYLDSSSREALQQTWQRYAEWPNTATCQLNTLFK